MNEKIAVLRALHAQASELVSDVRVITGLAGAQEAVRLEWPAEEQAQLDIFYECIQKLANGTCTPNDRRRYAAAFAAMDANEAAESVHHKVPTAH